MSEEKPFKRTVYFIGGLHPFGFRFFWPIIKRHARKHSKMYDRKITPELSGEWGGEKQAVLKSTEAGARDVVTTYRFMKWHDLVSIRMKENFYLSQIQGYLLMLKFLLSGDMLNLYRHYWGFANGILFVSVLPLTVLGLSWYGAYQFLNSSIMPVQLHMGLDILFSYFAACAVIHAVESYRENIFHFRHYYQLLKVRNEYVKGQVADLEPRIEKFKEQIKQAYLEDDSDEVLLVGHSYGTLLCIDIMDRIFREVGDAKPKAKSFGIVTLGAIHHFIASIKSASHYRDALKNVGGDDRIYWFEAFSPQDGLNFPKKNAVEDFTDVEPKAGPHQKSVRYRELVTPEAYKKNRRNFWDMHFQYLKEGEYQGAYSYFRIICSDQFLKDNYGLREDPVAGYVNPKHLTQK